MVDRAHVFRERRKGLRFSFMRGLPSSWCVVSLVLLGPPRRSAAFVRPTNIMAPRRRRDLTTSSNTLVPPLPAKAKTEEKETPRKKKVARREEKEPLLVVPPDDWKETWDMIVELRRDRTAVVDSMGSEALADKEADEETWRYQTLVSLMLSSQTKDITTAATMRLLREHGLTIDNILDNTSDEKLNELIYKVGFHNNKTKYIKESTRILREKYDSKVPNTMEDLCSLPGVGPKMALIVLRVAHSLTVGIAVDTHVHRICNQLGWTGKKPTNTPEKTRAAIESWIPKDLWDDFNLIIVGLGQEVQTEKSKLLLKALKSSDVPGALSLLQTLGVDVDKVAQQKTEYLSRRTDLDHEQLYALIDENSK